MNILAVLGVLTLLFFLYVIGPFIIYMIMCATDEWKRYFKRWKR